MNAAAVVGRGRYTLRCRWLLPMAGPAIAGGWVRIERGRVAAVGRRRPPGRAGEVVDLGDAIILPGLVNAHTHLEFSDRTEPLDAAGGLPAWIGRLVAARRARRGDGDVAAAIRRGRAESAAAGVTAIGEIATVVPVAAYAGPGPAARVFREGLGLGPAAAEAVPRAVAADVSRLAAAGLAAGISPHAPYSVSAPLGRRLVNEARRHDLPVAMHLCESEAEESLLATGSGPLRGLLEDLGAWDASAPPRLASPAEWIERLSRARRGLVVHATRIGRDRSALARLARHRDRLGVVVCPRTTRSLAGELPPVRVLAEAGLRVAIGTDSRASNPDLSVLAECRTLVDAGLASPADTLRMATIEGAWALALEDRSGRIAVGRPADLAVLLPPAAVADPGEAALDPATTVLATLRRGRPSAGHLA